MRNKRGVFQNKKGQLTIFIIIAIIIIGLAALVYIFYPNLKSNLGLEQQNPSSFIESCLEDSLLENLNTISLQGGSIEPENYILYDNQKIEYLCYSQEYYKTCVVQQPLLKNHVEEEIKNGINVQARECINEMKNNYETKGYNVVIKQGDIEVELLPKRIVVRFNDSVTLTKEGSDKFENLEAVYNNNIYELLSIATSIINWEAKYGDAETTSYMNYYRDLKVEKKKQSDGSTIYILTDRNNKNKFQFASRSVAWPPGYP
jgi:hypothetical protein